LREKKEDQDCGAACDGNDHGEEEEPSPNLSKFPFRFVVANNRESRFYKHFKPFLYRLKIIIFSSLS